MPYVRPKPILSRGQLRSVYKAIESVFSTAAGAVFTLHHITDTLPLPNDSGPYDIPADDPNTTDIQLHAMTDIDAKDAALTVIGEVIDCDIIFYVWLEEMEQEGGLGTTAAELHELTKDSVTYMGEEYTIVSCKPAIPFFGNQWDPGAPPNPVYDRNFLAAEFHLVRKGRD
jgi:hypothetical protein